jgi:hypothetical protein
MPKNQSIIPAERIEKVIFLIRRQKVILDRDLAKLYGVETRVLNQAVRRNRGRFPDDFMFSLTREEIRNLSQIVISSVRRRQGQRGSPAGDGQYRREKRTSRRARPLHRQRQHAL